MKTATRFLLLPILTLLIGAASARGQVTTTAYSNLNNSIDDLLLGGATATGGSTKLLADDLTYNAGLAGQAVSAFQVQIINDNSTSISITPTVIFWNSDNSGGPGTLLSSYVLPLTTLADNAEQTLSFTVPASEQFVLPTSGTIWAGIFVTGTSTTTAAQLNATLLPIVNPPTTGSSLDRLFESTNPGPAAAANPSGTVFTSPFGGNPVANLGWALTTVAPGTLNVLYNFPSAAHSPDGPVGALLLAADGNYYGTTGAEGTSSDGTIFQLTPGGTVSTIFEFSGANGAGPEGALIQGNDGLLYGTTAGGGANGTGTIFSIPTGSTTQALKVLHSFGPVDNNGVNADGKLPADALIQARDGNFYGVAYLGGRRQGRDGLSHHPGWHFHPPGEFRERRGGTCGTLRRADRGR